MLQPQNIVVAGANGRVGLLLVPRLAQAGVAWRPKTSAPPKKASG